MSALPSSTPPEKPQDSPWVLFGLDLRTIGRDWLQAMKQLHQRAPLRWFELAPSYQLLRADGSLARWQDGRLRPEERPERASHTPLWAIELPEALLLRRSLTLPDLPAAQIRQAVELDIASSSPFPADELIWGFNEQPVSSHSAARQIQAVFGARQHIQQYLDGLRQRPPAHAGAAALPAAWPLERSELWAFAPQGGRPIVLQGFAEGIAQQAINARRQRTWLALLLAAALLTALAVTPTWRLRNQAIEANQAYHALLAQASRQDGERTVLMSALESATHIQSQMARRVNPAEVIELLSKLLPNDVSALELKWDGEAIDLTAEAGNAAAIIQLLSEHEAFAEVRTTRPVQVVPRADKERFSVQMRLAPGALNTGYTPEPLPETTPQAAQAEPAAAPIPQPDTAAGAASTAAPAPSPASPQAAPMDAGVTPPSASRSPQGQSDVAPGAIAPAPALALPGASPNTPVPANMPGVGQSPAAGSSATAPVTEPAPTAPADGNAPAEADAEAEALDEPAEGGNAQ
ncbi:PilN domain-containing protein [Vandammella animalimorsus]|uniref:PilN domain-containing protein n=1 Tax=Vandammella animalimorsus TaxID=2029117 RepID=UPI00325AA70D